MTTKKPDQPPQTAGKTEPVVGMQCLDGRVLSKQWQVFLGTHGKSLADPTTIGAEEKQRHYLENRLHRAFMAGASAAEQQLLSK